ncbi:hypothetical protein BGZ63DRAFT_131546 [Mariannaea sp. PMI_226]|nr:hypothetical protein BGZ63DRAFT_131546 [Mariannaea sp. PMI_226]
MALLEFVLLKFNPDLSPDVSTPPKGFFDEVVPGLKAVPGIIQLYLGQVIEDPKKWQLIIEWESKEATIAFGASEAPANLQAKLGAVLAEPPVLTELTTYTHNVEGALTAPCTEVCTCWGADEKFHEERMHPFADPVDAFGLSGYHGMARGEFDQAPNPDPSVIAGHASRILLGWDSMEAHMAHKGVDSIIDKHVHLLMSRREKLEMYHVPLNKI